MLTCMGMVLPIIAFGQMVYYDFTFEKVIPASVLLLNGLSMFWYQTIDAIDGKQARKTDNCSCLG